jgi:hypothetical protein
MQDYWESGKQRVFDMTAEGGDDIQHGRQHIRQVTEVTTHAA